MKTTVKYEVVTATPEHAAELIANMRQEDTLEVWAMSGQTPEEAVTSCMEKSEEVWASLADGKVLCLFGTARVTFLGDLVCPWMLSTKALPKHARHFVRGSKVVIAYWKERHTHLVNAVDVRYKFAIRWLSWLGFTIHPAEPLGKNGQMFHRVTLET